MMNENQFIFVIEYNFDSPTIIEIDNIIDKCYRDCHNKYFHTFDYICDYDLNFTNITNKEIVNFTISEKSLGMYELNKKSSVARQRGYIFNQINNLAIKIYSNLSNINIQYHLKLGGPLLRRHFFKILSRNRDYIQTYCNDINNPFNFGCRKWFLYNNPGMLI